MSGRDTDIMRQGFMRPGKPPKLTAAQKRDAAERADLILKKLERRR